MLLFLSRIASAQTLPTASTQPDSSDPTIAALLAKLGSDDAAARQSAAADLIAIGAPARPAVLKAVHGGDPGVRDQAAQILVSLPWDLPDDPETARELLKTYNVTDVEARKGVAEDLCRLPEVPLKVLTRLLREDPSPEIRWVIVQRLRSFDEGFGPAFAAFRNLQPADDDSPLLALCGFANLGVDPEKARQYFQRCADQEFAVPTDDDGQFKFVIKALAGFAISDQKYSVAAELRRKQLQHSPGIDEDNVPEALLELFALQADHGPLPGLENDLKLAGPQIDSPKIQYALARLYARQGKKDEAEKARAAAWSASTTRTQREDVGEYLYEHEWDDLAAAEFNELLKMPMGDGPDFTVNAHFRLSGIAIRQKDDFTAAHEKEMAILSMGGDTGGLVSSDEFGHSWPLSPQALWAEIHWRYLRAALAKHDDAAVADHLRELLKLKPDDGEIAIEVVPLLREKGMAADSKELFDRAFATAKGRLDSDPNNPDLLNGLAWLCAKCDVKLDDAKTWATKALAEMPQNPAIMDTLAEVNFHLGNPQEAVRLETRALKLTPNDDFMTEQLRRFQAATTQPSTRPN
jgi:tetratricopeptide (TPR) repeat protein